MVIVTQKKLLRRVSRVVPARTAARLPLEEVEVRLKPNN